MCYQVVQHERSNIRSARCVKALCPVLLLITFSHIFVIRFFVVVSFKLR